MTHTLNSPRIGIGLLTALLHLALLVAFLQSRPVRRPEPAQPERPPIQWLQTPSPAADSRRPAAPAVRLLPPTPPRLPLRPPRRDAPQPPLEAAPPAPEAPAVTPPAPAEAASVHPARPGVDEIMRMAKRDIGKIDKDLQKEFPQRGERAPLDTPQARLERGFAAAHAAVRPKFYEAAKMVEISGPGGSGARVYKITTAAISYCIKILPTGDRVYLLNCPD